MTGPEALAAAVVDSALDGVLSFDGRLRITSWNRALERLTGISRAHAVGEDLAALMPLPAGPDGRRLVERTLAGESPVVREALIPLPGQNRAGYFDLHLAPLQDEAGGSLGGLMVVREVTGEREIRERLRESELRFRTMADSAPVLLWMSGQDSRCTFFNDSWLRFTGRPLERELGLGWAEGIHPEDFEDSVETYMEAFSERRAFRMEYRLRRHDGEYRWVLDTGVPRLSPDGTFMGFIGSCIDITELRDTRVRLERTVGEKDVLLREIHHRVKNNLQIVSSLMSMGAVGPDGGNDPRLRESQNRVRSMALIHEALYQSANLAAVEFGDYVGTLARGLMGSYARAGAQVELRLDIEPIHLPVDVAVPCGLLLNELISNALKHAFPANRPGVIAVELRLDGGTGTLEVRDNGVGMREGEAGRSDSLGLELARTLAAQLGGQLVIENDAGTTVTVRFPLAQGEGNSA